MVGLLYLVFEQLPRVTHSYSDSSGNGVFMAGFFPPALGGALRVSFVVLSLDS